MASKTAGAGSRWTTPSASVSLAAPAGTLWTACSVDQRPELTTTLLQQPQQDVKSAGLSRGTECSAFVLVLSDYDLHGGAAKRSKGTFTPIPRKCVSREYP